MKEVGAYEAKTTLPSLLRAVERGERVTITKSGKPVAELVPHSERGANPEHVIDQIRRMRRDIRLGGHALKALIEEGRR